MRIKFLKAVILVYIVLNIAACGAPAPYANVSTLSPVATPVTSPVDSPIALPIPTSLPGFGTVTGRLIVQNTKTPLMNRTVYLAPITVATDTQFSVAALDKTSPTYSTNGDGSFAFTDVKPGRYGLIMEGLVETVLLADLKTGKDIVVSVDADKTADLGPIEVLSGQ